MSMFILNNIYIDADCVESISIEKKQPGRDGKKTVALTMRSGRIHHFEPLQKCHPLDLKEKEAVDHYAGIVMAHRTPKSIPLIFGDLK